MELGSKLIEAKWLRAQAEKEAKKDALPFSERVGQFVGIVVVVIAILFFVIHRTRPTGFFTDEFTDFDAYLLYAILGLGIVPMLIRAVTGRKNIARPIEALTTLVVVVGALYFLAKFPFDFSHFADPLPRALEFTLDWIPATLAKVAMALVVAGGLIGSVYGIIMYFAVRALESKHEGATQVLDQSG